MPSDSFIFEERLFAGALALSPEERADFVRRACGGDVALRERIGELLRGHEGRDSLLDANIPDEIAAVGRALQANAGPAVDVTEWIGRYRLNRKIGEGGFGVVWLAEQHEPLRRQVALKILRPGMDTREIVARFEVERQALALMDHPNIARVFDGGATERGRPYFVMELVSGIPITRYCDERQLGTSARVRLFLQVCRAVQHAHQKGIVHRDLKPSNILVIEQDGAGVPKVIDFGIAKIITGEPTDGASATLCTQLIGTPAYMSPEQIELGGTDIDTRSDIYNLGVLLYELLTGHPPFDPQALTGAGFDQWRQIVRERDPPKPSTRIGTLESATRDEIARLRGTAFGTLRSALKGDLDWIVMRCMEKDRARRYDTANSLAADLESHLTDAPVSARPPTAAYILRKTVRRHRMAFAAGGAIAASLVLGIVMSAIETRRATAAERVALVERQDAIKARDEATAHKRTAEIESRRSLQVAQFIKDMLKGVGPQVARGRDSALLRAVLDNTAERMRRDLGGEPAVFADLLETVGLVYSALGEDVVAERLLRECLQLQEQLHGRDSLEVARLLHETAGVLNRRGRFVATLPLLREALAIREQRLGEWHPDVAKTKAALGHSNARWRPAEGVAQLKEALAVQRQTLGPDDPDLARTLTDLASWSDRTEEERQQGEAWLREALEIYRRGSGAESLEAIEVELHLARIVLQQGRVEEAGEILRGALARCSNTLADTHPIRSRLLLRLGVTLRRQAQPAEAEVCLRQALALAQHNRDSMAHAILSTLADLLIREGRQADAVEVARDALGVTRQVMPNAFGIGQDLAVLATALIEKGSYAEAEAPARACIARLEGLERAARWVFQARRLLGIALTELGRFEEAEEALHAAHRQLAGLRDLEPDQARVFLSSALLSLVRLYTRWDRPDEVALWMKKCDDAMQQLADAGQTRFMEQMKTTLRENKPFALVSAPP